MNSSRQLWVLLICVLPLIPAFLMFPQSSQLAAMQGVSIWLYVLLPALLPFFILIELLQRLGVVNLLGCFLEPLMRKVFRLPGHAGFVIVLGFLSGYPVAAKLTAQLRQTQAISSHDAERLVGVATTADPIFIISAVSLGFFQNEQLAPLLLTSHYGTSILLAWLSRYLVAPQSPDSDSQPLWQRLQQTLRMHNQYTQQPLFQMLREALENSVKLIFLIGGLVIFFCVYISLLTSIRWMNYFYSIVYRMLSLFSIEIAQLSESVVNGFFEVTLGIKQIAQTTPVAGLVPILAASFILSWAGLSVHAQIMSLLQDSAVRYLPFALFRLLHGLMAICLTALLWPWFT